MTLRPEILFSGAALALVAGVAAVLPVVAPQPAPAPVTAVVKLAAGDRLTVMPAPGAETDSASPNDVIRRLLRFQ
ncbi:hypothetical protein C6Y14_33495 [Streptomyces dioscori]|uniref:Uncharacterized protein n=1 Tax=Streptomyces dioscori TaxID=2109333 RepID=A0A2P8PY72_9ACTN|nr:hypothetical protein [Streptomyces dioscori]PSM38947.1 hypothetical protein C6Y14_33495 [Streptomyces dioscori]